MLVEETDSALPQLVPLTLKRSQSMLLFEKDVPLLEAPDVPVTRLSEGEFPEPTDIHLELRLLGLLGFQTWMPPALGKLFWQVLGAMRDELT